MQHHALAFLVGGQELEAIKAALARVSQRALPCEAAGRFARMMDPSKKVKAHDYQALASSIASAVFGQLAEDSPIRQPIMTFLHTLGDCWRKVQFR
jgi:hypothetical protein